MSAAGTRMAFRMATPLDFLLRIATLVWQLSLTRGLIPPNDSFDSLGIPRELGS